MKRILKYKVFTILTFVLIVATSCLNDDEHYTDFSTVTPQVELPEPANISTGTVARAMVFSESFVDVIIKVNLASPNVLKEDVKVTMAYDPAILTTLNAQMKASNPSFVAIPLLPSANLQLPADMTITIPAGTRMVDFKFKVKPNDVVNPYGVPFKIASVTPANLIIPSNFSWTVVQILVKNKWDGKYVENGFIMRPGDTGGLEGFFKGHSKSLATVGPTSVAISPNQLWANGGGVGGIGQWTITVNSDNTIVVSDPVAVAFTMDPTYPSRYDPATKTFFFKLNWGAAVPQNRGVCDTLVYTGPR
jgi:hypothetical protein